MSSSPSRPRVLTAAFVRSISRPGRYGDGRGGHGLSLLVKPTANGRWSKTWAQRLRIGGRTVSLGLGSYPAVSLALARERALANRQAVEEGRDPRRRHAVTFAEAYDIVARRCVSCHAAKPSDENFDTPPKNVVFDTAEQIRDQAPKIRAVAVLTRTMPVGNETEMTDEERRILGRWIAEGAEIE